tara:strand:- start:1147 stop:2253 length:1107 start_codon:yes stop_codon:yes gene_type:complete
MKILFCTNVYQITENGPVKFAHYLLNINHIYPNHELHILTEDISTVEKDIHFVEIPNFIKKSSISQFYRMWAYHKAAMKIRKEFDFDVLIYNHAIVGLWSCFRFPKTIGMINDDNYIDFQLSKFSKPSVILKKSIFRTVEKIVAKKAYKIFVNSNYLKRKILNEYHCPNHRLFVLYKGIDLDKITIAAKSNIYPEKPVKILFVKNDFVRGGLFILAQAIASLPYTFELTIVGTNPDSESFIKSEFQELENVTIYVLGKLPTEEIYQQLQITDIFCVPSLNEALGIANLEAIASGVPVVSSSAGGIPEILDQGNSGWLAVPGDPKSLAFQINNCIMGKIQRNLKVKNGLIHARMYSITNTFQNFLLFAQ